MWTHDATQVHIDFMNGASASHSISYPIPGAAWTPPHLPFRQSAARALVSVHSAATCLTAAVSESCKVNSLQQLVSIASAPIVGAKPGQVHLGVWDRDPRVQELRDLLNARNGFYAFESALHLFPLALQEQTPSETDLIAWNNPQLWRSGYGVEVADTLFFAEDAFGVQFGIKGGLIMTFDPESAATTEIAETLESWAARVLSEYPQLTGYKLAHAWQEINGPIPRGRRLVAKIPFMLGGAYEVDNLACVDAVLGMRYRAEMWRQIRDLPDGAQVRLMPLPLH